MIVLAGCYREASKPAAPPPIVASPSHALRCDEIGQRIRELEPGRAGEIVVTSCVNDAWDADTRTCIANARAFRTECADRMTKHQREAFAIAWADYDHVPPPIVIPAECIAYRDAFERWVACPASGAQAAQMLESFDHAWASIEQMTPAARASLGAACQSAADAVNRMLAANCP